MKVTLTNEQIYSSYGVLSKIKNKKLPISVCFAIMRDLKVMEDIVAKFEELRSRLFDKYAKKDANGNIVYKELENGQHAVTILDIPAFDKEFFELSKIDITIELVGIKQSSIMQLEDNDNYDQLTTEELEAISILFEEETKGDS